MLTGVFATKAVTGADAAVGWIDGNPGQVLTQFYGVAVTIVYDAIVSFILLKIIDVTIGLRVTEDEEREGLDITQHGESGLAASRVGYGTARDAACLSQKFGTNFWADAPAGRLSRPAAPFTGRGAARR